MELNKEILGNFFDIPIVGIKSVKNQQPFVEFMQTSFKMEGTSTVGVTKFFLKGELQLFFEYVNKVLLPRS